MSGSLSPSALQLRAAFQGGRITPLDAAGNAGTAVTLPAEVFVRQPDAPQFSAAFNAVPRTVTFNN